MRSAVPGPQPPPGPRPPPGPPPPGHPVSGVRGAPGSAPCAALDPGGVCPTCLVKSAPLAHAGAGGCTAASHTTRQIYQVVPGSVTGCSAPSCSSVRQWGALKSGKASRLAGPLSIECPAACRRARGGGGGRAGAGAPARAVCAAGRQRPGRSRGGARGHGGRRGRAAQRRGVPRQPVRGRACDVARTRAGSAASACCSWCSGISCLCMMVLSVCGNFLFVHDCAVHLRSHR